MGGILTQSEISLQSGHPWLQQQHRNFLLYLGEKHPNQKELIQILLSSNLILNHYCIKGKLQLRQSSINTREAREKHSSAKYLRMAQSCPCQQ